MVPLLVQVDLETPDPTTISLPLIEGAYAYMFSGGGADGDPAEAWPYAGFYAGTAPDGDTPTPLARIHPHVDRPRRSVGLRH